MGAGGIEKEEESSGWHRLRTVTSGWDSDDDNSGTTGNSSSKVASGDRKQKGKVCKRERGDVDGTEGGRKGGRERERERVIFSLL